MTQNKKTSHVMRQIDENLRRVYQQEETSEVPDRFKKLLEQLKTQGEKSGEQGKTDE